MNHPRITDLSDHRVTSEDGRQLASKHGVDFFEGSAKEGHGITEAFLQLSRLVLEAQQQHSNQGNLWRGIDIWSRAAYKGLKSPFDHNFVTSDFDS